MLLWLTTLEEKFHKNLSPFGESQHFLLPMLILQLFVVVLEENRKHDHCGKKKLTIFFLISL